MGNSTKTQKNQEIQELKHKYLHLKKVYCRIAAVLKHVEEELKSAQTELSLKIEKENIGAEELVVALKKQNKQLRKLNETKDKFISIIAHDLRSPFNSIIGFSSLLYQRIYTKQYDDAERISKIIIHSANSAMELLKDLMEWALVQTGNMEIKPEYINVLKVVTQVKSLYADVIAQKGITADFKVSPEINVYADEEMLSVVLRNLISNAVKFTEAGGRITVSAEKVSDQALISVADTGIGIPDNQLEELFHIGKSFKRSGTEKEGGTGMGLTLCKEFIEKHGGKIWVESQECVGSTFYFTIPT
ncbi:MAG: sensor histidine kinase [Bacteroidota bacterium]